MTKLYNITYTAILIRQRGGRSSCRDKYKALWPSAREVPGRQTIVRQSVVNNNSYANCLGK